MTLTYQDVLHIAYGGTVTEDAHGFQFFRMTDKQYDYFVNEEDVRFKHRYICSAGVSLDFYTDASCLSFDYALFALSDRDFAQLDVLVDGVIVGGFAERGSTGKTGRLSVDIDTAPGVFHRVSIWLPYMSRCRLNNIKLSEGARIFSLLEGAPGHAPKKRKKLLALGDSITQGYDALHPSQTYAARLARYFDWELWNGGLSGYQFDAGLIDENLPFKPDIVTIAFGTNDWNKFPSVSHVLDSQRVYIEKIKALYPDSATFYISPLWRGDIKTAVGAGPFDAFCDALLQGAADCGIPAFDGRQIVPHRLEAFDDLNLHPNDWGMSCYSEYLTKVLNSI